LPPGEEEKRAFDWSAASPFGGYQYDKAQEQPIEKKPKSKGCRERGQPISDPSLGLWNNWKCDKRPQYSLSKEEYIAILYYSFPKKYIFKFI